MPEPPLGDLVRHGMDHVYWLEAVGVAFPGYPSGYVTRRSETAALGPLTVAGPRRICTGFRIGPPVDSVVRPS